MKDILKDIFPKLKKELEQIQLTLPSRLDTQAICFNLRPEKNKDTTWISGGTEDFKNQSGIFFTPMRIPDMMKKEDKTPEIWGFYSMEILDIIPANKFRLTTTVQEMEITQEEEWVEKMMRDIGRKIDESCKKWRKRGKSKTLGITFPRDQVVYLTGPEIECELVKDTVSFFPIPNDISDLWLYHLVEWDGEDGNKIFFSPFLKKKIRGKDNSDLFRANALFRDKVKTYLKGPKIPTYTTLGVVGNYGGNGVFILPKAKNP